MTYWQNDTGPAENSEANYPVIKVSPKDKVKAICVEKHVISTPYTLDFNSET